MSLKERDGQLWWSSMYGTYIIDNLSELRTRYEQGYVSHQQWHEFKGFWERNLEPQLELPLVNRPRGAHESNLEEWDPQF